jgi:hypothetical protein
MAGDVDVDILEVVDARAANRDPIVGHAYSPGPRGVSKRRSYLTGNSVH